MLRGANSIAALRPFGGCPMLCEGQSMQSSSIYHHTQRVGLLVWAVGLPRHSRNKCTALPHYTVFGPVSSAYAHAALSDVELRVDRLLAGFEKISLVETGCGFINRASHAWYILLLASFVIC